MANAEGKMQGASASAAVEYPHMVRGIICAFVGACCWGFSGTCSSLLTSQFGVPVPWITCVRMLAAASLFFVIVVVRDYRSLLAILRDGRSLMRIAGFGILGVLLTQVSYLSAIAYTNAGIGTVLERLGLIVIMFWTCFQMWRMPKLRELAGLVLALAGTVLIATKGQLGGLQIPAEGLFFGIVSGFALAFYTLMPVKALKKWGPILVTGLAMFMGGCVACVIFQPWTIEVDLTPSVIFAMCGLVIVGTLGAYVLYLQGVADAGPVRASLIGCMEPVSALVISALWLGTPVVPIDVVGILLILAMVPFVTEKQREGAPRKEGDVPIFRGRANELGYLTCRQATKADLPSITDILNDGHAYLEQLGVEQGNKKYPTFRMLKQSIDAGTCHVVQSQSGEDVAVFSLTFDRERAYRTSHMIEGEWLTVGEPYSVLRWVTVVSDARRRGVGSFILGEADRMTRAQGIHSICGDVFPENYPMRQCLLQHGYTECGLLRVGSPVVEPDRKRVVFEKRL